MTAQLSREELRTLALKKVESLKFAISQSAFTNIRRELEGELQLAEFALAGMSSEPVAWRYRTTDINGNPNPDWSFSETESLLGLYQPLYAAPPAPVAVPEPIKRNDADGWWMYKGRRVGGGCAEWYNRALDDCRAAMQAEPVTAATGWIAEAKKLAELHGISFVVFRNGEEPQCADPRKVVISFTDEGLGYPAAPEQEV